jgi:hypothetical protein
VFMRRVLLAIIGASILFLSTRSEAQVTIGLGPRLSVTDDGDLAIGAEGRFGLAHLTPNLRIDLRPTFDYVFIEDVTFFAVGVDALLGIGIGSTTIEPYAIAGVGFFHSSVDFLGETVSDTSFGLNLGGGARFLLDGRIQPFAEARLSVEEGSIIFITAGVLFIL